MALCSRCDSLNIESFQTHREPGKPSSEDVVALSAYPLWDNGCKWQQSHAGCAFCDLLWASLLQAWEFELGPLQLTDAKVLLEPRADVHRTAFPEKSSDGLHLVSLHVIATARTLTDSKSVRGKICLFTDGPSCRPPLSGLACDSTTSLLRRWVAACKQQHDKCCTTLSGDIIDESRPAAILPSRVLCVRHGRVRIVHSAQRRDPYVALSHCWGPSDKRPLRALQSNIHDFEREIPWDMLPKTYQDATIIVRALGISYIWIDSLCIIQDDHDDWLRESALMGSVYERAEFTIAASHASNSTQGFLHPRPAPSFPAVALPNFLPLRNGGGGGGGDSHVLARLRTDTAGDTFPEHGALNTRSWATQEWLLSRLMLFFTPASIMWSCKTLTQRETGERCFNISRNTRWKTVVEAYSERQLTYPTDRLVALDGLRVKLQKGSSKRYLSGVWEDKMPDQLLWQVAYRLEDGDAPNPLGLPSWTWARMPCGVRFLLIDKAKNACHRMSVAGDGRQMTIRGWVKALPRTAAGGTVGGEGIPEQMASDISASHAKATSSLARYIVDNGGVIGWLVYDVQTTAEGQEYMLAVMSTLGRRKDGADRLRGDYEMSSTKKRQYWCLIFRKMDDGTCRRVGVAKSYSHTWWRDATLQDVALS